MLHIVHPYIFQVKGKNLVFGPVREHLERNFKLSCLVNAALAYSYPVFAHERITGDIHSVIEAAVLKSSDLFEPLFHPRVQWVGTDEYGRPMGGPKPSDVSEEAWAHRLDYTVTQSELADLMGEPEEILVCGGEYTCCEGNFMEYMAVHFKSLRRKLYIPELSVTLPEDLHLVDETSADLEKLGFHPISVEEAIDRVRNPLKSS